MPAAAAAAPGATQDDPLASLPRRSPSRVRFNFADALAPLAAVDPAAVSPYHTLDSSSSLATTAGRGVPGEGLISDPGTPTLSLTEAAAHIRRTLSLGSLTNLLDLATEAARSSSSPSTRRDRTTSLDPATLGSSGALGLPAMMTTSLAPGSAAMSGQSTASAPSPTSSIIYLPAAGPEQPNRSASAPAASLDEDSERALEEEASRQAALVAKRALARQTLRDVREAILRPSDEPPRRPSDWERVLVLTMLKSTRSFISAYGLRAGVNFLLFLVKAARTGRVTLRGLLRSIISATPLRFALLLSTFTFLHTLVGQGLRLAPPIQYVRRRLMHSFALLRRSYSQSTSLLEAIEEGVDVLSLDCSFGPPLVEYDYNLGERRWHAAASGAVAGGVAIYWVKAGAERRAVIEQVLVRGLEGAWRGTMRSAGWSVPHGEVVLFGLCAGQIMYSWIMAPERMPKSFDGFITSTFNGPSQSPGILRSILRTGTMDPVAVRKVLDHPRGVTLRNRIAIGEILETLSRTGGVWPGPPVIPHALLQPTHDHIMPNLLTRFGLVFKGAVPVYAALHTLPSLFLKRGSLLRRKAHAKDPPTSKEDGVATPDEAAAASTLGLTLHDDKKRARQGRQLWARWWRKIHWAEVLKILRRSVVGTVRSSTFLAAFVFIYHGAISAQHVLYPRSSGVVRRALVSKNYTWFAGFLTSLALFCEAPSRRLELALYVLPRSITAAYMGFRHRTRMPKSVPLEEGLLTAWAMAMLCDRMRWGDEKDLSRLARKVLYQFT